MDAVVVPAARAAGPGLIQILATAGRLDRPAVVLCSGALRAEDVLARAPHDAGRVVAVDVPAPGDIAYPHLETTGLAAQSGHPLPGDLALKRNLALLIAHLAGWERLALVDDDITFPDPSVLPRAARMLDRVHAAGPAVGGFPDGSVVAHAERLLGGSIHPYITSAFVVTPDRTGAFFPHLYNEDWLYLVGERGLLPVSLVGTATQLPYDPFADPDRARHQEFGEVLGVGLHWLVERGGDLEFADGPEFWRRYIDLHRRHLDRLLDRLRGRADLLPGPAPAAAPAPVVAAVAAVAEARRTLDRVTPRLCVDFMAGWRRDRSRWRAHLRRLPADRTLASALDELGLRGRWP